MQSAEAIMETTSETDDDTLSNLQEHYNKLLEKEKALEQELEEEKKKTSQLQENSESSRAEMSGRLFERLRKLEQEKETAKLLRTARMKIKKMYNIKLIKKLRKEKERANKIDC